MTTEEAVSAVQQGTADVIAYIITRKGHLAVNQVLVRAG